MRTIHKASSPAPFQISRHTGGAAETPTDDVSNGYRHRRPSLPPSKHKRMLPRTGRGLVAAALMRSGGAGSGCAQCGLGLGLKRRVTSTMVAAAASAGAAAAGPRALSTAAKKKEKKKGGGVAEEGGGDASKNAWYIKMLDEPAGPGCVH